MGELLASVLTSEQNRNEYMLVQKAAELESKTYDPWFDEAA